MGVVGDLLGFVVPAVLLAAWLGTLLTRGRVGRPFFAAASGLALLCFPAGIVAGNIQTQPTSCPADDPQFCLSPHMGVLWFNGFLGLCCCLLLLTITLVVRVLRTTARH